jgi:peptide/nickel transport system substrate-binding protein
MRLSRHPRRTLKAVAMVGISALALTACGGDSDDPGTEGSGGDNGGGGGTFIFGASSDPVILDGAYVSDGESLRVVRQVFEGLVRTEPGGTTIQPSLATDWSASEDGLTWTFNLRDGVTFHDGEPFNAEAVCFNFDRWYNFKGIQQSPSVSYYWSTVMGGFATNESEDLGESLYKSCSATDETTVDITLSRPSSTFVSAISMPSYSIASPKALQEYGADDVSGTGEAPTFNGTFGTEHPVGTGPFKFDSWEKGNQLVLSANEDYWDGAPTIDTLIFKPIADGPARRQALEAGEIDAYDNVDPADVGDLEGGGFQILRRPAFNVGYIGFNVSKPPLDKLEVRQAFAHAINRQAIIDTNYPEGSEVAKEFMPPELFGYADDVTEYEYDVEKAKSLLAAAGETNPTIELWYPTDVSRPYMPDAAANFQLIQADLEAAGFTVTPKSAPWSPDYLDKVNSGGTHAYLYGWTGDFGDPDNFVGTFFQAPSAQWGFENPEIFDILNRAEAETDEAARTELYQEANRMIMDFLPGLPYVHTQPAIAMKEGISGLTPSPVTDEVFNEITGVE